MKIKKGMMVETDVVIPMAGGHCNEWEAVKVHKVRGNFFWVENYKNDFKDDSQWKFDMRNMKTVNNYIPGSWKVARYKESKK